MGIKVEIDSNDIGAMVSILRGESLMYNGGITSDSTPAVSAGEVVPEEEVLAAAVDSEAVKSVLSFSSSI